MLKASEKLMAGIGKETESNYLIVKACRDVGFFVRKSTESHNHRNILNFSAGMEKDWSNDPPGFFNKVIIVGGIWIINSLKSRLIYIMKS